MFDRQPRAARQLDHERLEWLVGTSIHNWEKDQETEPDRLGTIFALATVGSVPSAPLPNERPYTARRHQEAKADGSEGACAQILLKADAEGCAPPHCRVITYS